MFTDIKNYIVDFIDEIKNITPPEPKEFLLHFFNFVVILISSLIYLNCISYVLIKIISVMIP